MGEVLCKYPIYEVELVCDVRPEAMAIFGQAILLAQLQKMKDQKTNPDSEP